MNKANIVIRADGSENIGMGHIIRCSALAVALECLGNSVHFVIRSSRPVEKFLSQKNFNYTVLAATSSPEQEAEEATRLIRSLNSQAVMADHYTLDRSYLAALKEASGLLICMDDEFLPQHEADLLINQNLHAVRDQYAGKVKPDVKYLLGTQYALLSPEFTTAFNEDRTVPKHIKRVLISFGGGDPDNLTSRCLQGLCDQEKDLHLDIVLGAAFSHGDEVEQVIADNKHQAQVFRNIDFMHRLMLDADIAFCAGGSTCWEIQCLGLPSVITIIAGNQRLIAESLAKQGSAVNLGWHADLSSADFAASFAQLEADKNKRESMSCIAKQLVDGQGADRVAKEIMKAVAQNRR